MKWTSWLRTPHLYTHNIRDTRVSYQILQVLRFSFIEKKKLPPLSQENETQIFKQMIDAKKTIITI